jgi:hypothetical protein
MIMMY